MDIDKYWHVFCSMMYKYIGIGLMGLFVLMIMPTTQSEESGHFFGVGTILVRDAGGNEIFKQTVHNQVTDEGEGFLILQAFDTGYVGTLTADAAKINTICITGNVLDFDDTQEEAVTAALFNAQISGSKSPSTSLTIAGGGGCIVDTDVDNSTSGIAIIQTPNPFIACIGCGANTENIDADTSADVTGIGICQDGAASGGGLGTNTTNCEGHLFAQVSLSNVTLGDQETIDITYTFDISSSTT